VGDPPGQPLLPLFGGNTDKKHTRRPGASWTPAPRNADVYRFYFAQSRL